MNTISFPKRAFFSRRIPSPVVAQRLVLGTPLALIRIVSLAFALGSWQASSASWTIQERQLFYTTRAEAKKGDAHAQHRLAWLYATGSGVDRDSAMALKWHLRAAEAGLKEAQFQVAVRYARGLGVKVDNKKAVLWCQKAACQGMAEAQCMLGAFYAKADVIEGNAARAAFWYRKAAEQGLGEAEYEYGRCCLEGRGAGQDAVEAFRWLYRSAERGHAPAQKTLGILYEKGRGVTNDYVQAHKWLSLAAAQGEDDDGYMRVRIAKVELRLSLEDLAQARRLAQEFKPRPPDSPGPTHDGPKKE
jgi:hypothetical protein